MADLVTVEWLAKNLKAKSVKILDCTWVMPGETAPLPEGNIPNSQYFDIDEVADKSSDMTHMLPSGAEFAKAISTMGIQNSDHVICYDRHGIRSSPRVWWSFKAFGHASISVLDGGLPSWLQSELPITSTYQSANNQSEFEVKAPILKVTDEKCVFNAINTDIQIVDARPLGRFNGTTPEPRPNLRSGRIPSSLSLPFGSLKAEDGTFLSLSKLAELVGTAGINLNKPIITSCGSGVTAAGIALVLWRLGAKDITLYDGSWTEWGASELPLEK